ncbi:MAG: hypothetical protein ABS82_00235 [Rhodanobacter sp. SCN 67-45]|nr:MAG: hypothetical protein ABS82_00235 [Rhodanobacter sp. SCN 67-45]
MNNLTIRNAATGEIVELVRDVRHTHPGWVHAQCETESESELQAMLDQVSVDDYVAHGRDECGIAAE